MPETLSMELLLLIAVLLLGLSWLLRTRRLRHCRQRQLLGLQWLMSMAQLLGRIQQHRGLSSGLLNGGVELAREIEPLQLRIARDISDIRSLGDWVHGNERWLSILDHWQRLSSTYKDKDAASNLKQHNALIRSVLFLIDDMAQAHDLLLLGRDDQPLQLLWRELLTATEYIGQARAIGTGLSAAGNCDSVSRIRLNYLCQKILADTDTVWRELALDNNEQSAIHVLVTCIRNQVIQERVSIKPAEFFEIASRAMNSLYEQYQRKLEQQRGLLSDK